MESSKMQVTFRNLIYIGRFQPQWRRWRWNQTGRIWINAIAWVHGQIQSRLEHITRTGGFSSLKSQPPHKTKDWQKVWNTAGFDGGGYKLPFNKVCWWKGYWREQRIISSDNGKNSKWLLKICAVILVINVTTIMHSGIRWGTSMRAIISRY